MGAARMGAAAIGGVARGGAYAAGAASGGFRAGASDGGGMTSGVAGAARTGATALASPLRQAASTLRARFAAGGSDAVTGFVPERGGSSDGPPAWARRMRRGQTMSHGVGLAAHALKSGDGGGAGASVSITEKN
jgi:type IV secretion system protein TrbL